MEIDLHEKEDESASANDSIVKEEENGEEADTAETEKFVINDVKDGKEENGVPAKTIQFLEEGTYELDIMAVDTEENKAEMTVMFKVGDELLSYVKGFQDWIVEVKETVKVVVVSEKEALEQADEGAQVTTSGGKAKKDSNGKHLQVL